MIAMCSGGFSILHVGHLDCLEAASQYGRVVVALNSDEWLQRKYGFIPVPWTHRARMLAALRIVDEVVPVDDSDGTVCEAIRRIRPAFFVNGGDRQGPAPKEHAACMECETVEIFCETTPVHSSDLLRRPV